MTDLDYGLGDIIEMKKPHPCRLSKEWQIIRMGADIRIKCQGCQSSVLMPRSKFEKRITRIVRKADSNEGKEE